jgi:hypothetical protein
MWHAKFTTLQRTNGPMTLGSQCLRGRGVVALFRINQISIAPLPVRDASGGVDSNGSVFKPLMDVRERTQLIIALDQKCVLRARQRPARPIRRSSAPR